MTAVVMFLMLLVFATSLAVVLSCYRDDEPAEVLRGTVRRALSGLSAEPRSVAGVAEFREPAGDVLA